MKTVTTQRIVLDRDERKIAKTWGRDWPRMWADIKKFGRTSILTGRWSGYLQSQGGTCHSEYVLMDHANGMRLKTIVFTDGTTLQVEIRGYTLEDILKYNVIRKQQYDGLVREARESMQETYCVELFHFPPDSQQPGKIMQEQAEKEMTSADRIRQEQEGNNWYDKM